MGIHDLIDIGSILGVLASTIIGVLLANRLNQHSALETKVQEHESRLASVETALEWIRKLFKQ